MRTWLVLIALVRLARADSECAAPSTCRPECTSGDVSACVWLGEYYLDGQDMVSRPEYSSVGLRLLEDACTKGSGEACAELATGLSITAHLAMRDADDKRRAELRAKACKAGYADACPDPKQRLALLDKACSASSARACLAESRAYEPPGTRHSEDPPPPPDDDSGGTGTAMALDHAHAVPPDPIKRDATKAKRLRTRALMILNEACAHGGARTCDAAGGFDKSPIEKACKAGASRACRARAFLQITFDEMTASSRPLDNQRSADFVTYIARACDLGDFIGCDELAAAYEAGDYGLKADLAKAIALETKACDAHDGSQCARLGKRADDGKGVPKDLARALTLYRRACDEGAVYGCEQAGDSLIAATRNATKDAKAAIDLYARACELEDGDSALFRPICSELAKRYDTGSDVAKDAAKAKLLRDQGCKRGEKKACSSSRP